MAKLAIVALLLGCFSISHGYPNGILPPYACVDMFPHHSESDAQLSPPPFSINVQQDTYLANSNVTVHIIGNNAVFKGFFLQARMASCTPENRGEPVGMFLPSSQQSYRVRNCTSGYSMYNNAVSHVDASMKGIMTFTWRNPYGGAVFFQATVVQSYNTFWTGIKSSVLKEQYDYATYDLDNCPSKDHHDDGPNIVTAAASTPRLASLFLVALVVMISNISRLRF